MKARAFSKIGVKLEINLPRLYIMAEKGRELWYDEIANAIQAGWNDE